MTLFYRLIFFSPLMPVKRLIIDVNEGAEKRGGGGGGGKESTQCTVM